MDTVCNEKFSLKFISSFGDSSEIISYEAKKFTNSFEEFCKTEFITVELKENINVSLLFESAYTDARLYLEGFDGAENNSDIAIDEEGELYKKPSHLPLRLFDNNAEYVFSLRVGFFKIRITVNNESYFGVLRVSPSVLDEDEWLTMKNDLESEMTGLAQDIIKRNIGLGDKKVGDIPLEQMYKFLVIQKYSKDILAALMAIKDNPRYKIVSEHIEVPEEEAKIIDSHTIKQYLQMKNRINHYSIPIKVVDYDLTENRLLKRIIKTYESEVGLIERDLMSVCEYYQNQLDDWRFTKESKLKLKMLADFQRTIKKCSKITNVIKQADWYKSIPDFYSAIFTHAFAMDSRYGILYRFYCDLHKDSFNIKIDPRYSYGWKISSNLYEMWCYVKLYHLFYEEFIHIENSIAEIGTNNILFSFLEKGTTATFVKDNLLIKLVFDKLLPISAKDCDKEKNPMYFRQDYKNYALRPDIVIHMYNKEKDIYLGSIILECKYRKIKNFWFRNDTFSAKTQIRNYNEASRSPYFRNLPETYRKQMRPVLKVFVLNPDDEEKLQDENSIVLSPFKPKQEEKIQKLFNQVKDILDNEIKDLFGIN